MKKLFGVTLLAAALVLSTPAVFAAEPAKDGKDVVKTEEKKDAKKGEAAEKTGTVEFKAAEKGEKHDTYTLKVGAETFKLLPSKEFKNFNEELKKVVGKEVTVKGELLPANEKHPLAAIKIESCKEAAAAPAADAKPADAPAAPAADAKPADAPAAPAAPAGN